MPLNTFQKLLVAFAKTRLVFLQGWGEPFLNPNFFEMVRLAKAVGCRVATTTNGIQLDAEKITRLVQCGLDIIAFSLAGVDEKNDNIRKGTSLESILNAIRMLNRAKEESGATQPMIHIAYMLLRSRLNDVEGLPALLLGLDINQVVISTLDFVPSSALANEVLVPATEAEYNELRSRLDRVVAAGERCGLDIHYQLVSPGQGLTAERSPASPDEAAMYQLLAILDRRHHTCTENIQRAVFVSSDGEVSPCVYTNLPVSETSFVTRGIEQPYRRLTFGNIRDQPLETIWESEAYVAFRRSHQRGTLSSPCLDCLKR